MSPRPHALAARWTVLLAALLAGCGGPAPSEPRDAAGPVPADWLNEIQGRIAASEYRVRPSGAGAFEATNRAQDYRARFEASGVVLTPRAGPQAGYRLDLRLAAWGREGSLRPPATATPADGPCLATGEVDEDGACLRRLDYPREGIVEWWENRPEGLRQGFTVAARPGGEGALVVELAVGGMAPRVEATGEAATFDAPAGGGLRYSGLAAWDAGGRALAARMEASAAGLRLVVDDAGAAFPVTIDPVLTTYAWSATSDQAGAQMGGAVATAGDVDGDGYADVIVGAPGWSNGQTSEGRALLYLGSASGLSTTPAWTAESNQETAWFGASVASAGDVNGDGFSDVIVGAWGYSGGQAGEGRAYLYLGSAAGLASVPSWTAESNQADAWFGISVASAGDVNGDGHSDVIVGASKYDDGHTDEGAAFVYHGSASGLGASPAWTGQIDSATAYFGCSVASAGDVNADGYSDVIVGAYGYSNGSSGEGGAFAYHGSASGLAASPNWATESNQASASLGQSVAGVGDVNGDGYGDVVVGVPQYDGGSTDEGRVYAFHGGSGGLATNSAWYEEADSSSANFGYSVAAAGDVNGDGYADVAIGAHNRSNGQTNEGQAHVYVGSSSGLKSSATWTGESNQTSANFGRAVAGAGDVDGDGLADVVVGAPYFDDGETDEGRAYVFLGAGGAPSTSSYWLADSGQTSAHHGYSVSGAGDVNGDGYSDVVVGAYAYDGGDADEGRAYLYLGSAAGLSTSPSWTAESNQAGAAFGYAVAGAGDVNGDGYSDVLVGARTYDDGDTNEGRAYVYHGSSSGLGTSPAWTAESNQADAYFGTSVSGAGDVDGDGYSDVIVGATYYDNGESGEGRAYVYLGSAGGLATAPAWTAEGDQASASLGYTVCGAGDVNGDGYGDVVVGAPYFDNGQTDEGRAFVYLGSESGLGASPAWTAESNQASATFGYAVSGAGDVNGDGYGDVIVGAPSYDNGHTDEGRAYVFLGSSHGLAASPAWTAEGDQSSAQYGRAVSSAGDVDGDGYGDVITGALYWDGGYTNEGGAWLYLGSGTGPSETAAWSRTGLQSSAYLGVSLASAGDVNGDGFGDLVIGAYAYDNGSTDEGVTLVLYGNTADGTYPAFGLAAQARQVGGTTPIQPAGWSDDTSAFDVAMKGRTPFGRGRVKLQVEAKPPGVPFDGLDLHTGTAWADTTLAGVELQETLDSLDGITGYHWRARLRYRPSEGRPQLWSHWVYGGVSGDPLGVHVVTGCGEATWYADGDGDGFGDDATAWVGDCHRPPGYVAVAGDCNDLDPDAFPGADEACNGRDDDCDGTVDEGAMGGGAGGADADGDGYGTCGDEPDCDDGDPTVHPGATETCDGEDDDCDGDADEGFDADGDGYGTCGASPDCADGNPAIHPGATESCNALDDDCDGVADEGFDADGDGYETCGASPDCDDTDPAVRPGAVETCDGEDDDCDGTVDEGFDADGDGHKTCGASPDCDDSNATVHPGATDTCNGVDDDCDGEADEGYDADGDGYSSCGASPDCDDGSAAIHPGAAELCNGADDDCDGTTDEGFDADGDGYKTCGASSDCDDTDPTVRPGATEVCNGVDDDCDGSVDEGTDADGDGYTTCDVVPDCNDANPAIHPGAAETCNGTDDDCDGVADEGFDADSDGFKSCGASADCDDGDPGVHPGATETCDGEDDDCDGTVDDGFDADGDGYKTCGASADCDDGDATVHPGATESCDGEDDDCDGVVDEDVDADGDGYSTCGSPADCDDSRPAVHPGATEVCDGLDGDCDPGTPDGPDADGDGYACAEDCDEGDPDVNAGAEEACGDGVDEDCDGDVDDADLDQDGAVDEACGGDDCDDEDAGVYPGAPETCNGLDDDCDGETDEGIQSDRDGDGALSEECGGGDCDDTNGDVRPGAAEVCDGLDNDCDGGTDDVDQDADGHAPLGCGGGDCDDAAPAIGPDADEACDGVDNDCDGVADPAECEEGGGDPEGGCSCDARAARASPAAVATLGLLVLAAGARRRGGAGIGASPPDRLGASAPRP